MNRTNELFKTTKRSLPFEIIKWAPNKPIIGFHAIIPRRTFSFEIILILNESIKYHDIGEGLFFILKNVHLKLKLPTLTTKIFCVYINMSDSML